MTRRGMSARASSLAILGVGVLFLLSCTSCASLTRAQEPTASTGAPEPEPQPEPVPEEILFIPTVVATWQLLQPTVAPLPAGATVPLNQYGGPVGRCDPAFVSTSYSTAASAILYGGQAELGPMVDAWSLDLTVDPPQFNYLPDTGSTPSPPTPRIGGIFEYLPDFHQLLMFGGQDTQYADDIHVMDTRTGAWTQIQARTPDGHPTDQPFARGYSAFRRTSRTALFDPILNTYRYTLILYGGSGDSAGQDTAFDQDQDDLWAYFYTYDVTAQTYTGQWLELEARICIPSAEIIDCPDGIELTTRYPSLRTEFAQMQKEIGNVTYRPEELVNLLTSLRATVSAINTTASTALQQWLAAPNSTRENDNNNCAAPRCLSYQPDPSTYPLHPPRMEGHRASLWNDTYLVYFGGYTCLDHGVQYIGGYGCYINDVWFLDLMTYEWSVLQRPQIPSDDTVLQQLYPNEYSQQLLWPSPRAYHSQVIYNDRLYIYGGGFKSDFGGGTLTYFHDMAILDLLTLRWVLPDIQGAIPAGAWSHGLVVAGDSAYLVGGCTDDGFSDLVYRLRFDQKVMPENIYMSGPGLETNTTAGVETYFLIETREVLPLATPQSATKTAVRRTRAEGSNEKAAHTASAGRKNTGKARDFDILMTSDHQARRPTRQANQKKQAKKAAASSSKHVARTTILHAPSSHVASFSGHPHGRSLLSASKAASDPASAGFGPLLPWGTQQQFLVQLINEDRTLTRAQVTELGGGRYNVSYTLGHGFMFSLLIKLANTVLVTAAPLIVYNNPQGPDAVAGGVILTADSAIKGETLTAKLQLLDQLGNEIRRGGDVKGAVVDDATGAVSPTASHTVGLLLYIFASSDLSTPALVSDSSLRLLGIKDHADGTYAVEFRVPEGSFDYYAVQIVWDGVSVPAVTTLNASPMPVVLRAYDQSELSADLVVVGYVLTSICVAVVLGYMVILSIHSEARVVKASSYFFLMTLCSGVLLCFIAAFLLSITTDASCRAYPLVLGFGYNLLIGSLFVKSQRIMSIFTTKRLQVQNLSNLRTGIPIALLLAAELIFAIAWLASSPLSRVGRPNTNNPYQTYVHCDGPGKNGWVAFTIVEKACLMVYGIYLATKTRNVPRAYNESKLMAFSLYNISFTVLIGILLIYLTQSNDDLNTPYITQVLVILWCCMWTASALIVPRIYYLIYPPGPDFFAAHVRKASQGVQRRSGGKESALSGMGASQSNLNASTLPRPTPLPSTAAKQPANSSKVPAPMARKPLPVAAIPKGKKDAVELQAIQHTSQPNPAMMEEGPSSPSTSTSTLSPVGGVKLPRKVSLHDLNLHLPSPVNVAELAAAGMEEHVAQETRRASTFGGGAKVKDSKLLPQGTSSDDYEPEEDDVRPPVPSEPYPSDVPARAGSTPPPSAAASSSSAHAGDDEEAVVHSGTSVPDVVSPFALKKQVHRPSVDFTPASQPPPPEDSSEEED